MPEPRTRAQRLADTRHHLEHDIDAWVATADPTGGPPALVPLSFGYDGETILLATERSSPAGRNMAASGRARLALGGLRDVVMIDASASQVEMSEIPESRWAEYSRRTGWDPRESGDSYVAYLVRPESVQAWRESNEIQGRVLMRDGAWLT